MSTILHIPLRKPPEWWQLGRGAAFKEILREMLARQAFVLSILWCQRPAPWLVSWYLCRPGCLTIFVVVGSAFASLNDLAEGR